MRLLFVLPRFPFPPADGGRAKVFNILKYLSARHPCDLICFGGNNRQSVEEFRQKLPSIGSVWIVPQPSKFFRIFGALVNLMCLRPPSFARYSSKEMAKRIESVKQDGQYDAIHFDIINMAPYQRLCRELPSIHSPNDATSLVYWRLSEIASSLVAKLRLRAMARLLANYERKHYANFSKIHVVSDVDRDYLARLVPGADIDVVPISSGYSQNITVPPRVSVRSGGPVVTVCGNLGDAAIAAGFREFLDYVLPLVSRVHPELRIRVLGRCIDAPLQRYLERCANVEYFTWVNDFEEFLAAADVLLLPDQAGAPGPKTRTVQAMALGRAVLGSSTAFEGLDIVNGYHGAIYTTKEECHELLLLLLSDRALRETMGNAAAKLAADEYSIERIGPQYEAIYQRAIRRHATLISQQ